uniref:Uncharacterized protein n=1 Tax=Arion vulgaris TaxID=1028688 RepID=A0A0B6YZX4_9EUPU
MLPLSAMIRKVWRSAWCAQTRSETLSLDLVDTSVPARCAHQESRNVSYAKIQYSLEQRLRNALYAQTRKPLYYSNPVATCVLVMAVPT